MSQVQDRIAHLTPAQRRVLLERLIRERDHAPEETIPRREGDGVVPVSFAQARLWFADRLDPGTSAFNMLYTLRLRGALDRGALARSFTALAARHEALRTTFAEARGEPLQVVHPPAPVPLPLVDLGRLPPAAAEAEARLRAVAESLRGFDLARGPLLRATQLRLGEGEHVLVVCIHHIVADGLSLKVLVCEVSALYAAYAAGAEPDLPPLPVQYADFAVWQRARLTPEVVARQVAFWRERLDGAPPLLEVPTDRPRAPGLSPRAGNVVFLVADDTACALRELARQEGATLFMVILAAWQALLARYSGQDDVVVGAPVGGRPRVELEGLIGCFVNTLALRADLSGGPTFRALLARVRETTLDAYQHQDLPFERLVEELGMARTLTHSPVFQVTCAVERGAASAAPALGGARIETFGVGAWSSAFPLDLRVQDEGDRLVGEIAYQAALFDGETVERMAAHLATLLAAVAADPGRRPAAVPLLGEAERVRVLEEWNPPAPPEPAACLHHLFAAQATRTPHTVAVVAGDERVRYAELDRRANRLAHHLRARGVGPDAVVGVCVERTPEMVVALLAILKAGGAYAPLDPGYPAERLALMAADAGSPVIVTQADLCNRLPAGIPVVRVDADAAAIAAHPDTPPEVAVGPDHLAYVIYTSGSTGTPKGTMVPHRAIPGFFRGADYCRFDAEQVLLQHSSPSWDALTLELWPALLTGGCAVLYPGESADPEGLAREVARHGVTTLWLSAALFNLLVDTRPEVLGGARQVMTGGEAVSAAHVARALALFPHLRVVNGYGPSECTVFAACHVVEPGAGDGPVPIGRPVGDRRVYLLDGGFLPVPVGVAGEVFIGGPAVPRGYRGRPALTAERLVPDPFGPPGARLYRTGDRARWVEAASEVRACGRAPDSRDDPRTSALPHSRTGVLKFVGRMDAQVKIRGFRVEPGEIEAALLRHPGVREAVVVAREDAPGDRRLVAYTVAEGEPPAAAELRAHLQRSLPAYLVPAAFVALDALPLTANRKLDRAALPAPQPGAAGGDAPVAPRTPTEAVMAGIWAEVLAWGEGEGAAPVGVHDSFFALGGHSLLATQVVARVRQTFGVDVPLRTLFEGPTVAELSAHIDATLAAGVEAWEVEEEMERLSRLSDEEVQALLRDG